MEVKPITRMRIRHLGLPPENLFCSIGKDFMRKISPQVARTLCGMYPTPESGLLTVVAFTMFEGKRRSLYITKLDGDFWLCSLHIKVDEWPLVFRVEMVEAF